MLINVALLCPSPRKLTGILRHDGGDSVFSIYWGDRSATRIARNDKFCIIYNKAIDTNNGKTA